MQFLMKLNLPVLLSCGCLFYEAIKWVYYSYYYYYSINYDIIT